MKGTGTSQSNVGKTPRAQWKINMGIDQACLVNVTWLNIGQVLFLRGYTVLFWFV